MRIVVSGTHASGKSTLISDFALHHPDYTVLPDPFDLIAESWDRPGPGMFAAQLRVTADRLLSTEFGEDIIAERGPLDFLAYLSALDDERPGSVPEELIERSRALTAQALENVDLLVVLPLTASEIPDVGEDELPELRRAMNEVLLELLDDPDLIAVDTKIVELTGSRDERLSALEGAVGQSARPGTT